jgi:hypothetical protein
LQHVGSMLAIFGNMDKAHAQGFQAIHHEIAQKSTVINT